MEIYVLQFFWTLKGLHWDLEIRNISRFPQLGTERENSLGILEISEIGETWREFKRNC